MKQKKMDIAVLVFCVIFGVLGMWFVKSQIRENGDRVVVRQAGKVLGVYSLRKDREIIIQNRYGENKIDIRAGKVSVIEANCRDQICVKHKPISRSKENIICLPNKLMIEIIRLGDEEVDMFVD